MKALKLQRANNKHVYKRSMQENMTAKYLVRQTMEHTHAVHHPY
jgi:hypothetical protein